MYRFHCMRNLESTYYPRVIFFLICWGMIIIKYNIYIFLLLEQAKRVGFLGILLITHYNTRWAKSQKNKIWFCIKKTPHGHLLSLSYKHGKLYVHNNIFYTVIHITYVLPKCIYFKYLFISIYYSVVPITIDFIIYS